MWAGIRREAMRQAGHLWRKERRKQDWAGNSSVWSTSVRKSQLGFCEIPAKIDHYNSLTLSRSILAVLAVGWGQHGQSTMYVCAAVNLKGDEPRQLADSTPCSKFSLGKRSDQCKYLNGYHTCSIGKIFRLAPRADPKFTKIHLKQRFRKVESRLTDKVVSGKCNIKKCESYSLFQRTQILVKLLLYYYILHYYYIS